jgi:TolB protein
MTRQRVFTILIFCLIMFTLGSSGVLAAKYGEIIASIRTGVFEPYRIGIDDFVPSERDAPDDVRRLAKDISDIVRADLDFSYLFVTRAPDPEYLKVFGVEKLSLYDWEKLYVGYVLVGEVSANENSVIISYTLYSVHQRLNPEEIFSRRLRADRSDLRLLAHSITDDVYTRITDLEGIFRSRIAYSHADSLYKEIYICDFDGHSPMRATFDRSIDISPRWASADEISYTSYKRGNPDLWLLDMRKGQNIQLSSFPGLNSAAAWSPDGSRYAVTLSKDGNAEIYVFRRGSSRGQRLTYSQGIDSSPTWSPDGKYLAFTSDRSGTPQVYIMDIDGDNVQRLTYQGSHNDSPAWSPTLDIIAFVSRGGDGLFNIWTVSTNGANLKQLTSEGDNENPQWSPDGLHLVFSSTRGAREEIYTMEFTGRNVRRITRGGGNSNPSWSPK